jgi:hypothetical protein
MVQILRHSAFSEPRAINFGHDADMDVADGIENYAETAQPTLIFSIQKIMPVYSMGSDQDK